MPRKKTIVVFIVSSLTTFLLASIAHSQFVLADLAALGITVNLDTRIAATLDDLLGLLPGYGGVIAVGLMIAFSTTRALARKITGHSSIAWYWWSLSGGLAMLVALLLMKPLLDITLIAGARSMAGLTAQCVAGLLGGAVFSLGYRTAEDNGNK